MSVRVIDKDVLDTLKICHQVIDLARFREAALKINHECHEWTNHMNVEWRI